MQPQPTATVQHAVSGRVPSSHDDDLAQQSSYHQPSRWSIPARRRTDVYVVEISRSTSTDRIDDDALLLTA